LAEWLSGIASASGTEDRRFDSRQWARLIGLSCTIEMILVGTHFELYLNERCKFGQNIFRQNLLFKDHLPGSLVAMASTFFNEHFSSSNCGI
jgi:hypothetical protein